MSSCKTIISSQFANHDPSPSSIQIDRKQNATHKFLDLAKFMFKPILIRGMFYVEW